MLGDEKIGDWSKARLDQYIRRVAAASFPPGADAFTAAQKLTVADELELSARSMAYIQSRISFPSTSYGTTLPTAPRDGDEHVLVDSATNPSYQWRFRFNAGSTSAYKWEFVGGAAAWVQIITGELVTVFGVWTDLATLGPQFIVPRAGDYLAWGTAVAGGNGVGGNVYIGIATGAGAPTISSSANPVNEYASLATMNKMSGLVAGDGIRMRYFSPNDDVFANRVIFVQPVRVS